MFHWCAEETLMVMSSIPFVGFYFRKLHAWYSGKFPEHKQHCHATGIDVDSVPPELASQPASQSEVKIPFPTTPDEQARIPEYIQQMRADGSYGYGPFDPKFLFRFENIAYTDQGVFNLLEMWYHCKDPEERDEIAQDMLAAVRDYYSNGYSLTNPNVLTQEDLLATDDKCCGNGCCKN